MQKKNGVPCEEYTLSSVDGNRDKIELNAVEEKNSWFPLRN